jgi:predicted alpha-1,2-mannosidase
MLKVADLPLFFLRFFCLSCGLSAAFFCYFTANEIVMLMMNPCTLIRKTAVAYLVALLLSACSKPEILDQAFFPIQYVDPLIGTGAANTPSALLHSHAGNEIRGQTFPAVGSPRAMTNWTPQTRATEVKCLSPYYYEDSVFQGFRGSHWMSGSCTQDYGSFTLMAGTDVEKFSVQQRGQVFRHTDESAAPHRYEVTLEQTQMKASVTGTARTGLLEFAFPQAQPRLVIFIEPNSDEGEAELYIDPEKREVWGKNPVHRIYQGWGKYAGFDGYLAAAFPDKFAEYGVWAGDTLFPGQKAIKGEGKPVGAYIVFENTAEIQVKCGTSFSHYEGAVRNREAEMPEWDFDAIAARTAADWNELLDRMHAVSDQFNDLTMFYTALYHSSLLPRTFSDVDGTYPAFAQNQQLVRAEGFTYYNDFSLWDTFRALHPLLTMVDPQATADMVNTLLTMGTQGGWLPIFPCWNNYTSAMIGDHAIAMITDAHAKGITQFDQTKAWQLMHQNAFMVNTDTLSYQDGKGRRALQVYLDHGYLPMEEPVRFAFHREEQVSRTLEYAYNDFTLAQYARRIGQNMAYQKLMQRAKNYRNVYDQVTGYMRGRHQDGSWFEPFDPYATRARFITEGSPFQYTWFVPHDVYGLMELMGGATRFETLLDSMFQHGHYWHGNEPGHQIPYLYPYVGKPWKTQEIVAQIIREEYGTGPGGLSGNEDAGQLSAWLVWSMAGFYPVCPGTEEYVIGRPFFPALHIQQPNGKRFSVIARKFSPDHPYIQSITLDGKPFLHTSITHGQITRGGFLEITMGPEPGDFGRSEAHRPANWMIE